MKMVFALLFSTIASPVLAALGGSPTPRAASEAQSAKLAPAPGSPARIEVRTTMDSGTEVHEYLNPAGTVFAVAWSGPSLPDLQQLLGTHFQALLEQQRQRPGLRPQTRLRRDDLVIVSRGRMGAFEGRAWVPSLLPPDFSADDIR